MHSKYELVIEQEDPAMSTVVPLRQSEISIGRKPGNTILLGELNVSRYHARLIRAPDAMEIEDLNSYNGVLLNGQRITGRALLQTGDRIQIGDYRLALRRIAQVTVAAHVEAAVKPPPGLRSQPTVLMLGSQPPRRNRRVWLILVMASLGLLGGLLLTQKRPVPRPSKHVARISTQAPQFNARNPQPVLPSSTDSQPGIVNVDPQSDAPRLRRHSARPHPSDRAEARSAATAKALAVAALGPPPVQGAAPLEQAQAHYIHGEFAAAVRVARGLTTRPGPGVDQTRAWRLLGAAACRLGDLELLNEAYRRVDSVSRQFLQYVCQQANVTRTAGRFELAR